MSKSATLAGSLPSHWGSLRGAICYHPFVPARRPPPPVAIIGTGLIGGSFGLALKQAGYKGLIRGYDRKPVLARARARGAVDIAGADLAATCRGAAIILLALPVGAIIDVLPQVAAAANAGALITDAGSTKRRVMQAAQSVLVGRPDRIFIGGHPMAGRESGGIDNARADLFTSAAWILVGPGRPARISGARVTEAAARTDPQAGPIPAAAPLSDLLDRIGAHVIWTDAALHDAAMARLSHLPQLVSTALACGLEDKFTAPEWRRLLVAAGPGARDMLRLAASPYALWRDILLTNSDEIEAALREVQQTLDELRQNLRHREMERYFTVGAAAAQRVRQPRAIGQPEPLSRPGGKTTRRPASGGSKGR